MASATDIITYIGVPLAVLGVLPILWTALRTFRLSLRIRRTLKSNLTGSDLIRTVHTYTDIIAGRVEVRFPVTRLHPLNKSNSAYAQQRPPHQRSLLPGGSWTALHWSVETLDWLEAAPKSYVITEGVPLRQPAALIGLGTLVRHLLDLGAIVHIGGLQKLLTEGHRVFSGTALLTSRDDETVLGVANKWHDDFSDLLALRLYTPGLECLARKSVGENSQELKLRSKLQRRNDDTNEEQTASEEHTGSREQTESREPKADSKEKSLNPGINIKTPSRAFETAITVWLASTDSQGRSPLSLDFKPLDPLGLWVGAMVWALATHEPRLSRFNPPAGMREIGLSFSELRPIIPCGLLVHCGFIPKEECSVWKPESALALINQRTTERRRQRTQSGTSVTMVPRNERSQRAREVYMEDFNEDQRIRQDVEDRRVDHALASPPWSTPTVAGTVLPWLHKEFGLDPSDKSNVISSNDVIEWTLMQVLTDTHQAAEMLEMLKLWETWKNTNAVTKRQALHIEEHRFAFAVTACILGALQSTLASVEDVVDVAELLAECEAKFGDVLLH